MSEEDATSTESSEGPEFDAQAFKNEIQSDTIATVKAALEKHAETAKPAKSEEEIRSEIQREVEGNIIKRLSGGDGVDSKRVIHETFVNEPEKLIGGIYEKVISSVNKNLEDRAKSEQEQRQAEQARRQEQQKAYDSVLKDRVDITNNDAALKIFTGLLSAVDESKSEEDAYKEAVSEYDKLMEAQGLGSKEKRIAAMGLDISSGAMGRGQTEDKRSYRDKASDLAKQDLDARKEARKKAQGR